jgi:uncharacterized protein (TIGR02145 family)
MSNKLLILILPITLIIFSKPNHAQSNNNSEIKVGNQIWTSKNLSVDKFRNGDWIKQARNENEWKMAGENKQPIWCFHGYNSKNEKFGRLYNWYAVNDPRGLAPEGYQIPDDMDWSQLIIFLDKNSEGGSNIPNNAGFKAKSKIGWWQEKNGNDEYSLNFLPSGYVFSSGKMSSVGIGKNKEEQGISGYWWSTSEHTDGKVWNRSIYFWNNNFVKNKCSKGCGLAVRCIKK